MKQLMTLAAIPLLALAGVAVAQDTAQTPATAPTEGEQLAAADTAPQSEEDARMQEMQCRTERVTGSRTRTQRICMTRGEWHELESGHADNVRTMQGRASGGAECRGNAMGGC